MLLISQKISSQSSKGSFLNFENNVLLDYFTNCSEIVIFFRVSCILLSSWFGRYLQNSTRILNKLPVREKSPFLQLFGPIHPQVGSNALNFRYNTKMLVNNQIMSLTQWMIMHK